MWSNIKFGATTATTTSTKKTVLVAFYFFICSIRLRWAFARNSEADISKRELSIASETDIAWRCSHHALFRYACISARTLHFSCMHASVLAPCMIQMCLHGSGLSHLKGANSLICTRWANSSTNTSHWERNDYTHTKVLKAIWERTHHTHTKVVKAVWERAPIQYGSELTKPPLWMTWIRFCLFVLFACLFV